MNTLSKIISTFVVTAMLSLPLFGAAITYKPNVNWSSGATTNSVNWI